MSGDQLTQSPDEGITTAAALHQLKDVLSNTPHDWQKSAFAYVQQVRPELVTDDHMLKFLEVEEFNVEVNIFLFCVWQCAVCTFYLLCCVCWDIIHACLHAFS